MARIPGQYSESEVPDPESEDYSALVSNSSPLAINNTDLDDNNADNNVPPPVGLRQVPEGIGWFATSMLIVNTALGGGLLNFPRAFHEAGGVFIAASVQFVLILFIVPALLILAYCSDFNESKTMQDVLHFTWGKFGQRLTSVTMAMYCFGANITYLIIIGDQLDQVFAAMYGNTFCNYWYMNRNFTLVITSVCFILPMVYPKKIDFLKHVSSVGVIAVVYVVFLIIGSYYSGDYTPGPIKTQPDKWTDIFLVVPTLCFGYQCHVSIIPIYACLKKRSVKNFSVPVFLAIAVCVFTYTVAAAYAYLTFGANIESDVLKSYNPNYPSVLIANVAVAVKTYASYPVNLFCGREAMSDLWLEYSLSRGNANTPSFERLRRITIASILFFSTLILAVVLPNIGAVIKILGSLASLFVFFFPGMCLLRISLSEDGHDDNSSNRTVWLTIVSGMYLALGAFIFGLVLTQGIYFDFVNELQPDGVSICQPDTLLVVNNASRIF